MLMPMCKECMQNGFQMKSDSALCTVGGRLPIVAGCPFRHANHVTTFLSNLLREVMNSETYGRGAVSTRP